MYMFLAIAAVFVIQFLNHLLRTPAVAKEQSKVNPSVLCKATFFLWP